MGRAYRQGNGGRLEMCCRGRLNRPWSHVAQGTSKPGKGLALGLVALQRQFLPYKKATVLSLRGFLRYSGAEEGT